MFFENHKLKKSLSTLAESDFFLYLRCIDTKLMKILQNSVILIVDLTVLCRSDQNVFFPFYES